MPAEVEAFLPSLEKARAGGLVVTTRVFSLGYREVDLISEEPTQARKLAAVSIDATVLHRDGWEQVRELSEGLVAKLPLGEPPPPATFETKSYHVVREVLDATPRACTMCGVRPGFELCGACNGRGYVFRAPDTSSSAFEACAACEKAGYVKCSVCDGSKRVVRARLRYIDDRLDVLRTTYVPSMTPRIDRALDEAFEAWVDPPECLRFDPAAREAGGPYRGGQTRAPTFHGHDFGDALERAMRATNGLAGNGEELRREVKTFAWPILWLTYTSWASRRDLLLCPRRDGALYAFVTK